MANKSHPARPWSWLRACKDQVRTASRELEILHGEEKRVRGMRHAAPLLTCARAGPLPWSWGRRDAAPRAPTHRHASGARLLKVVRAHRAPSASICACRHKTRPAFRSSFSRSSCAFPRSSAAAHSLPGSRNDTSKLPVVHVCRYLVRFGVSVEWIGCAFLAPSRLTVCTANFIIFFVAPALSVSDVSSQPMQRLHV